MGSNDRATRGEAVDVRESRDSTNFHLFVVVLVHFSEVVTCSSSTYPHLSFDETSDAILIIDI